MGQVSGIHPKIAEALDLTSLDPQAVAGRLAEIGDLRAPTRAESVEFLVSTLQLAVSEIPVSHGGWSWGEVHFTGIYEADRLAKAEDPVPLAICVADLGLIDQVPSVGTDTLHRALTGSLVEPTNRLLRNVIGLLKAAGISPHGPSALS